MNPYPTIDDYSTPVKAYSKGELARMYFPNSSYNTARRLFNRLIHSAKGLLPALSQVGYRMTLRSLPPLQVKIIFDYLGEP